MTPNNHKSPQTAKLPQITSLDTPGAVRYIHLLFPHPNHPTLQGHLQLSSWRYDIPEKARLCGLAIDHAYRKENGVYFSFLIKKQEGEKQDGVNKHLDKNLRN